MVNYKANTLKELSEKYKEEILLKLQSNNENKAQENGFTNEIMWCWYHIYIFNFSFVKNIKIILLKL